MRYYSINVSATPNGSPIQIPAQNAMIPAASAAWTSYPNGTFDPAAQDVLLDIYVGIADIPLGGTFVRIWGVPLQVLNQAQLLQGGYLTVIGGMGAGLPLNNPSQVGPLVVGQVRQAFGNWVETDMTMDLVVYPPLYTYSSPGNIVLTWQPGQTLATALANCLTAAYPGLSQNINISGSLVNSTKVARGGYYPTLESLAQVIRDWTKGKFGLGASYPGVGISVNNNTVTVQDGTGTQPRPTQLVFTDLIGQPTWLQQYVNSISVRLVMRGDLQVGGQIKMPANLSNQAGSTTLSAQQFPTTRSNVALQGAWTITQMRHLGRFRSPNGGDWCTILTCIATQPSQSIATSP